MIANSMIWILGMPGVEFTVFSEHIVVPLAVYSTVQCGSGAYKLGQSYSNMASQISTAF